MRQEEEEEEVIQSMDLLNRVSQTRYAKCHTPVASLNIETLCV